MEVNGQHHTPALLYPRGKDPWYPLDRRLVGLRAGLDTEARGNILCLCQGLSPSRLVVQFLVSFYAELSQFSYGNKKKPQVCLFRGLNMELG
jgi:hypothetical protein